MNIWFQSYRSWTVTFPETDIDQKIFKLFLHIFITCGNSPFVSVFVSKANIFSWIFDVSRVESLLGTHYVVKFVCSHHLFFSFFVRPISRAWYKLTVSSEQGISRNGIFWWSSISVALWSREYHFIGIILEITQAQISSYCNGSINETRRMFAKYLY